MRSVTQSLRYYFYLVLAVSLVAGLLLYAQPSLAADFWPYAIKPLATRMFASMFLAVAAAAFIGVRASNRESMQALLVFGAAVFGLVLVAGLLSLPDLQLAKAGTWAWLFIFSAVPVVSLIFLVGERRSERGPAPAHERTAMPPALKWSLLGHTMLVVVFGILMFAVPEVAIKDGWPWKVSVPVMRGLGGLFLGVGVGTAWCYAQRYWERVWVLLPSFSVFVAGALVAVALQRRLITAESPGTDVTVLWLLVYVWAGAYPVYFLLRPPSRRAQTQEESA